MKRIAASAVLLLLVWVSLSIASQQASLSLATAAIDRWREFPAQVPADTIERYLQSANRWPDADAGFQRARWLAAPGPHGDPEAALSALDAASQLRPAWYRPWSARAVVLARQDPSDPVWKQAYRQALARGPNETRLFASLFPVWRLNWHRLTSEEQAHIHNLTLATLGREPALVVDLAARYGYLGPVCQAGSEHPVARRQCDKLGYSDAL